MPSLGRLNAVRGEPGDVGATSVSENMAPQGQAVALEAMSAEELETTLQSAVASLFQDGLQAKATAVNTLANIVDRCEGAAAEAVGRAIRDFGALDPLLLLLDGAHRHHGAPARRRARRLTAHDHSGVDLHHW